MLSRFAKWYSGVRSKSRDGGGQPDSGAEDKQASTDGVSDAYVLKLDVRLEPQKLEHKLRAWEPWGHRIDFSNGVSTANLKRRTPFSSSPLQKLAVIARKIPFEQLSGGSLLDIGCNSGYNAIHCATSYQMRSLGVDIVPRHIEVSRFLADVAGVQADYLLDSAETFSRPGGFDVVLHLGTLYHLRNPLLSLSKAYENLKPGGWLALETQVYDHPDDSRICYFMNMHNDDSTNYWALSTEVLNTCLRLTGFEQTEELLRAKPPRLAKHMSRVIVVARKSCKGGRG